ncbi:MAG: class II glutamine amidotransferase [Pelagibacterales bacterium]|nr:class II glutamine amidotransferase [Pelagibacterales bacterium]
MAAFCQLMVIFGVGWYSDKTEPGLFKDAEPAWANENLYEICSHVKARIFMAHVRAASTGSVQRTNAHPFKYKNWLFQHNGFIGNFDLIRRDLHAKLSHDQYNLIRGTTDSEVIFRLAISFGLMQNPQQAIEETILFIKKTCKKNKIDPQITMSCVLSDGDAIYTIRYSTTKKPSSQFYSKQEDCLQDIGDNQTIIPNNSIIIVSEPLDHNSKLWKEMPINSFSTIRNGLVHIEKLKVGR